MSNGVNDGGGLVYPFVHANEETRGLFLDAKVSLDENPDLVLPLRLSRVDVLNVPDAGSSAGSLQDTSGHGVQIVDATNAVVFEAGAGEYRGRSFSSSYYVHEWRKPRGVVVLVQRNDKDVSGLPSPYVPTSRAGILDERAVTVSPPRLRSVRVLGIDLDGRIEFVGGYNAEFAPVETLTGLAAPTGSVLRTNKRTMTLAPGAGDGRFPGCEELEKTVNTIRRQKPDGNGNFRFEAKGCYQIVPSLEGGAVEAGTLELQNHCAPCCVCDDYVNVYLAFTRVVNTYAETGAIAETVNDRLQNIRDRWVQFSDCIQSNPMKMMLVSPAGKFVVVTAVFCNTSDKCRDVRLVFSVSTTNGDAFLVDGGAYAVDPVTGEWRNASVAGSGSGFSYDWTSVDPGQSVKLVVTLQFETDCPCVTEVTCTGPIVRGDIPPSITKSISVLCATTGAMNIV